MKKYKKTKQTKVRSGGGKFVDSKQLLNDETRDYILMIKESGKFYRAYDNDALIINVLIGYQVLPGLRIGFPDNALSKVLNRLEENKISYRVIVKGQIEKEYSYKNLNQYDKYVILSRKTAMLNDRLEMLVKEIKRADRAALEKIIGYIEKCLRL